MEESRLTHSAPQLRLDAERAILALLVCPDSTSEPAGLNFGAPVGGRTRLMKELFLFSMETEAGHRGELAFRFSAGPYGPSSFDVQHSLEDLSQSGDIQQEVVGRQEGSRVSLTPQGYARASELWTSLPANTAQGFYAIKSKFNRAPLSALLFYVYSSYPSFTVNSKIREEVLGPLA